MAGKGGIEDLRSMNQEELILHCQNRLAESERLLDEHVVITATGEEMSLREAMRVLALREAHG